jgi:integrase
MRPAATASHTALNSVQPFWCVAYETLARRSEFVALELRDLEFWPNGTGQALIRRGKTDAEGQGRVAYLSRETVKWLKIWLEHAKISEGEVFRRLRAAATTKRTRCLPMNSLELTGSGFR